MGHTLIAIDPGSNTGWAIYENGHLFLSGESKRDVAVQEIISHIKGKHVDAFAIENMYFGAGRSSPRALYMLGFNTGYISGLLEPYLEQDTERWNPQPGQWRKVLGIAKGKREEVAVAALQKAEDIAVQKLEGPRGGKQTDRAMAICIGMAMLKKEKGDEGEKKGRPKVRKGNKNRKDVS